ncbi:MAG: GtrA family protein [Geminicoccaceae bacterium]
MGRFISVGMVATVTYLLVVIVLTGATTLQPSVIVATAYLVALPISYLGHRRYTFGSERSVILEFLRFLLAHGTILLFTQLALNLIQSYLPDATALYHFMAIFFIFVFSFIIMKFYVF